MKNTTKTDVYQIVTDRILSQIDKGVLPWSKPWFPIQIKIKGRKTHTETHTVPCAYSRATGKPYSLINQMLLGRPGEWASFKQITEAGGKIKKGEKSSVCAFWKFLETEQKDKDGNLIVDPDTGAVVMKKVPYLRYYNVFHVATQCEGIKPKDRKVDPMTQEIVVIDDPGHPTEQLDAEWESVEEADAIIRAYVARSGIGYTEEPGSDKAFYRPFTDSVTVPCRAQFHIGAEFYSTTFHELTHSTGSAKRLNRLTTPGNHAFGSQEYSKEELVAEIGAACLNSISGVESEDSFANSASYIAGWSRKLKEDRKMIVFAAAQAEKAVRYILGDSTETEDPDTDAE